MPREGDDQRSDWKAAASSGRRLLPVPWRMLCEGSGPWWRDRRKHCRVDDASRPRGATAVVLTQGLESCLILPL